MECRVDKPKAVAKRRNPRAKKRVKLFVGREGKQEEEGRDEKRWMSGELYFG